jgi:hypothetical protein
VLEQAVGESAGAATQVRANLPGNMKIKRCQRMMELLPGSGNEVRHRSMRLSAAACSCTLILMAGATVGVAIDFWQAGALPIADCLLPIEMRRT